MKELLRSSGAGTERRKRLLFEQFRTDMLQNVKRESSST